MYTRNIYMDLQNQFKDLNLDKNLDKQAKDILDAQGNTDSHDESNKIIKDLEERLSKIRSSKNPVASAPALVNTDTQDDGDEEVVEEEYEEMGEESFLDKIQPFILPICLTLFAIIFAGLFLYFFSKSRVQNTAQAIVNAGVPEQVYYPPAPVPVVVKEEPLKCTEPQILNEAKDACIDPEPEPEPEPVKAGFEDGTTTEVKVRFSYDKFNYDNSPRGIFVLKDQVFDGDYENFKIAPTNRAFANDYFFGVDRYTVSLIGSCSYVIDDANILVKNMIEKDNYFTGQVVKVIEASKPRVECEK